VTGLAGAETARVPPARTTVPPGLGRLLVTTGIYPPDVGGPATYVERLARTLVGLGHPLTVVATSAAPSSVEPLADGSRLWRFTRAQPLAARMAATARRVRREAARASVVYANGCWVESLAGAWGRAPVVVKAVGDQAWELAWTQGRTREDLRSWQHAAQRGARVRGLWLQERVCTRFATAVVVASAFMAAIVEGWGVRRERIVVLPNAVELPAAGDGPRPRRTGRGMRALSGGRLLGWKRFDHLLRVVAAVPDLELTLVGDGPDAPRLRALAETLGVGRRVRFVPSVHPRRMQALYRAHDLFLLASTSETFSYMTIEALAAGLPAVVADAGALPETVGHGAWGTVCPAADVEAWAAAVDGLARSAAHREELSRRGREAVRDRYDWQVVLPPTLELLAGVARRWHGVVGHGPR
jgi:glycosyltransferase involved in cell wall biosynthesis